MYNFLLDADALIKLAHSGALRKVCETFSCIITPEVKRETVEEGKKRLYPDAEVIELLIQEQMLQLVVPQEHIEPTPQLHKGELSILSLARERRGSFIVTDDQKFIRELEKENQEFLVPVEMIVILRKARAINTREALEYLEKMKTYIREEDYLKLKKELEGL